METLSVTLAIVADLLIEERAGGRALRQLQLNRDGADAGGLGGGEPPRIGAESSAYKRR
jgi:hypothetical protein